MTWDEAKVRVEGLVAEQEDGAKNWTGDYHSKNAVALRLLLAHAIPREDRERALEEAQSSANCYERGLPWRQHEAEARRLLKLDEEERDA